MARTIAPTLLPRIGDDEPDGRGPHSAIVVPIRARGQAVALLVLGLVDPDRPAVRRRRSRAGGRDRLAYGVRLRQRAPLRAGARDRAPAAARAAAGPAARARCDRARRPVRGRARRDGGRRRLVRHDHAPGRAASGSRSATWSGAASRPPPRWAGSARRWPRWRRRADGPGALLHALERFAEHVEGAEFATACYAVLDPATGDLVYASAGHVPMLLVDRDGRRALLEDGRSAPLCGLGPEPRPEAVVRLEPGSSLLVFTDGLVERRREHLSEGLDRVSPGGIRARARVGRRDVRRRDRPPHRRPSPARRCRTALPPAAPHRAEGARAAASRAARRSSAACGSRSATGARRPRCLRPSATTWLLAVSEAGANAIEHAYHGRHPGEVELELHQATGTLHVTIRDFGRWRPQGPVGDRGRGTPIMEALASRVERTTGASGTTIRLRFELSAGDADGRPLSPDVAAPVA